MRGPGSKRAALDDRVCVWLASLALGPSLSLSRAFRRQRFLLRLCCVLRALTMCVWVSFSLKGSRAACDILEKHTIFGLALKIHHASYNFAFLRVQTQKKL